MNHLKTVGNNVVISPIKLTIIEQAPSGIQYSENFTILFLLSGSVDIQLFSGNHTMGKNDIVFLPSYAIYSFTPNLLSHRILSLTISRDFLKNVCPHLDNLSFERYYIRGNSEDPAYENICSIIARIIHVNLKKDINVSLNLTADTARLLAAIIESYSIKEQNTSNSPVNMDRECFLKILSYINDHYQEKISLNDIAEHIGFHPQYFSKFFKKHFHANFTDYVNEFRVNKSLPDLLYTNKGILEIAVQHGFNNHKTYGAAVKKVYGMLPKEYRLSVTLAAKDANNDSSEKDDAPRPNNMFAFFQKYWTHDHESDSKNVYTKNHITVVATEPPAKKQKPQLVYKMITIGRASSCLRTDIQNQLFQAAAELHLDYAKIRDIFSDELSVYYEDTYKGTCFRWSMLDLAIDVLMKAGVKPFIEIGFMPSLLASKKVVSGFKYHPVISKPRSMEKWKLLIKEFITHYINKYGVQEVRTWLFDFWFTPNIPMVDGFWHDGKESFFDFYKATYDSLKSVDPELQIGSPNFSLPGGLSWYNDFFAYCKQHDIDVSYVSVHGFSCDDGLDIEGNFLNSDSSNLSFNPHLSFNGHNLPGPQKDGILYHISLAEELMAQHGMKKDIILSDSNVSYVSTDFTRDTCFLGTYLLYSYAQIMDRVKGICIRSLSDIYDDYFSEDSLFHGGYGLLSYIGVPKASYYTLSMFNNLSPYVIDKGDNYIITKTEQGYRILLYNMVFYDALYRFPDTSALSYTQRYNVYEESTDLCLHLYLTIEPGYYDLIKEQVNRDSGSSYDLWLKMGMPVPDIPGVTEYIKQRSIPERTYSSVEAFPTVLLDEVIHPHGATLITLKRIIK